jgi:TRAP-type mannitol/chloroaromatic compound transport system permease small subunit
VSPDPGGLWRYPIKAAIPVAFFLLGLQGLSEIAKRAAFLRGATAGEVGLHEPDERRGTAEGV